MRSSVICSFAEHERIIRKPANVIEYAYNMATFSFTTKPKFYESDEILFTWQEYIEGIAAKRCYRSKCVYVRCYLT